MIDLFIVIAGALALGWLARMVNSTAFGAAILLGGSFIIGLLAAQMTVSSVNAPWDPSWRTYSRSLQTAIIGYSTMFAATGVSLVGEGWEHLTKGKDFKARLKGIGAIILAVAAIVIAFWFLPAITR